MAISKISATELATVADANTLVSTYSASGTTIERGETFTLPSAGTTAVSNGALRLEALKGDCTITNNGNSTLTNVSGVNGTVIMRSGASEFPAFVRNSSLGSMEVPERKNHHGVILQVKSYTTNDTFTTNASVPTVITNFQVQITPKFITSKILLTGHLQTGGNADSRYHLFYLMRGTVSLAEGDHGLGKGNQGFFHISGDNANRPQENTNGSFVFLDAPHTTSQITYSMKVNPNIGNNSTTKHFYLNRPENLDDDWRAFTSSTITAMEVGE